MKEVILASFGTRGDLNPFLGLGQELQQRGYRVTLLSNQYYAADAKKAGLRFFSTGPAIQCANAFGQGSAFINMEEYSRVIGEQVRKPMFRLEFDFVAARFRENPEVIVILSRFDNGAYLACEKYGIRTVRLCLSPLHVRITRPVPEQFKQDVRHSFTIRMMNNFREIYELPPLKDYQYFHERADLEIGMFPEWFGDFDDCELPETIKFAGFPLFDLCEDYADEQAMNHISQYGKPFIFMMDSCLPANKIFFETSLNICQTFFVPGIFVTHDRSVLPDDLPKDILAVQDRLDLKKILPHVSLLIHTGGIGTCARAMEAGIPQIVIPRFTDNDQPDNGLKVALFGSGGCLTAEEYNLDQLPKIIFNIINKKNLKEMRENIQRDISSVSGLHIACNMIAALD